MIGKKINQLATELAPVSTDLTIIGDPISGVSKKITLAQLGAIFSGAVSFYTNLAGFPATGDINVIYCAKDTQKLYLWSGSAYTEVFPSQALLDTYQLRSEKGVSNGYASLDSSGKVPISQLPSSIMEYKGTWNAATNTPTLANGTGDTGDVYICNVAGTVDFGAGPITFAVGDYVIYSGTIWQRSSGAVGTVTSVAASITGNAIGITGSPVTTSGTLAFAFAGTSSQYINGAGNLTTFPTLTGYVPYTGATANVDLGTYDLTADFITASRGSYTSSGGGNTLEISHTSGSGIALNITKGGNGEGLYINKTSGSGNAATIVGTLEATTLVKTGGTSSQFLKADGSVDSSTYVTTDTFQNISASKTFAVGFNIASAGGTNQITNFANTNSLFSGSGGSNVFGFNSANNIYFGKGLDNGGVLSWNNSAVRYYTLPDATGTIALVGGAGVGTVTSVGLSSATSGVTIGSTPITTSGTITLAIATASGSQQGLLSSTDWTTFNNKQDALTNPVTGTGTTNYLPKFTGTSTIGNSIAQDNGSRILINTGTANQNTTINASKIAMSRTSDGAEVVYFSKNTDLGSEGTANINGYDGIQFRTQGAESVKATLNASGNLGIGTATPNGNAATTNLLHINGSTSNAEIHLTNSSTGSTATDGLTLLQYGTQSVLFNLENDAMLFGTNNTERARITSAGELCVGRTSAYGAGFLVNVEGNIYASAAIVAGSSVTATSVIRALGGNIDGTLGDCIYFENSGYPNTQKNRIRSSNSATNTGNLLTFETSNGTVGSYNNNQLVLRGDGNVGIGTTSPANILTVVGGAASPVVLNLSNANSNCDITMTSGAGGGLVRLRNNLDDFQIHTAGSERMRITSGGLIAVNSSTVPNGQMYINGGSNTDVLSLQNVLTTGAFIVFADNVTPTWANAPRLGAISNDMVFRTVATERMRITSGGDVGIGTSSPSYALDVYRDTSTASYVVGRNGSGVQTAIGVAGDNGSLLGTLSNHNLRIVTNGAVVATFKTTGVLNLANVPTSSAGLSSGDIYKSAGVLMIV